METSVKSNILVVEDDYENQKFLQIFLRRKFNVDLCDSDESFYNKLREKDFDIFLMDISLRGKKDGLQLTEELRKDKKYSNIGIVGLSAHAFQKDKDNAYNAGVDYFLTKPVQNKVLLQTLSKTLKDKSGISI